MSSWTVKATVTLHIETEEPPGDQDVGAALVAVGDAEIEEVEVITVEEAY